MSIIADYTSITTQMNIGSDGVTNYTGAALAMAGSAGANELRLATTGGGASISSSNWPFMGRPVAGTSVVSQLWAFSADTTGLQVATYDGTNTKANQMRYVFDPLGNPVSTMQVGAFTNSTHTAPSPGTQPPGTNNDAFTNGSTDTSNTSHIKASFYGSGLTAAGVQETPSAGTIGTMPVATTGAAGLTTTTAGNWLNANGAWQSLQGFNYGITGNAIPHTLQSFFWYFSLIIFLSASMSLGTYTFATTSLQYSFT